MVIATYKLPPVNGGRVNLGVFLDPKWFIGVCDQNLERSEIKTNKGTLKPKKKQENKPFSKWKRLFLLASCWLKKETITLPQRAKYEVGLGYCNLNSVVQRPWTKKGTLFGAWTIFSGAATKEKGKKGATKQLRPGNPKKGLPR